jgi:hypothetical protein
MFATDRFSWPKRKPVVKPLWVSRPALKTCCCAWKLTHLLFTRAKAFPIASQTPDATGAIATAVIAGSVHELLTGLKYKEGSRAMSSLSRPEGFGAGRRSRKSGEMHLKQPRRYSM